MTRGTAGFEDGALDRLNEASVRTHFHPFEDVDWSEPFDPASDRWAYAPAGFCSLEGHPLWETLSPEQRRRLALMETVNLLQVGIWFENLLGRGLLKRAEGLRPGDPEHRYLLHEVSEEALHSMMFGEVVRRAGVPCFPIPKAILRLSQVGPFHARHFPALFFCQVVAGEEGPDFLNRATARDAAVHPVLRRVSEIHMKEEARHLAYARLWLKRELPRLSALQRARLRFLLPLALKLMIRPMVRWEIYAEMGLPDPRGLARSIRKSPVHKAREAAMFERYRAFLEEVGLLTPFQKRRWRWLGAPIPAEA